MSARIGKPMVVAATGVAYWTIVTLILGVEEAWDTPAYLIWAYPGALLLAGLFGAVLGRPVLLWGPILMLSQMLVMVAMNDAGRFSGTGVVLLLVTSLPAIAAAWLGLKLRQAMAPDSGIAQDAAEMPEQTG